MELALYVGSKIKYFRNLNKLTQDELGERLGLKKATISHYENGVRSPDQDKLFELADIFDISIDELFPPREYNGILSAYSKLEPPRQQKVYNFAETQLNEQNNVVEFPDCSKELIRGRRMAGGSALHVDDTDARKEVVSSALIPKGADELVEVVGKSMEPLIKDGEEVYIRYQPTVENGEIAVVRIENEGVTCKRVYVEENSIRLKAENPDYEDMYYDAGQVTVLGKVLL